MYMEGKLKGLALADLLQTLSAIGVSADILVECPSGRGEIFLRGGKLLGVRYLGLVGEEALMALLSEKEGRFVVNEAQATPEENIHRPAHEILLDFTRRVEEGNLPTPKYTQPAEAPRTVMEGASTLELPFEVLANRLVQESVSGLLTVQGEEGSGEFLLYQGKVLYARWRTPMDQTLTGARALSYFREISGGQDHLLNLLELAPELVWAYLPYLEGTAFGGSFRARDVSPGSFLDFHVQRKFSGLIRVMAQKDEFGIFFYRGKYLGTFALKDRWKALPSPFEVLERDGAYAQIYELDPQPRKGVPWSAREQVYPMEVLHRWMNEVNRLVHLLSVPFIKAFSYRSFRSFVERVLTETRFPGSFDAREKKILLHSLRDVPHEELPDRFRRLVDRLVEDGRSELGRKAFSRIEKELSAHPLQLDLP